jgi:hypothetical protein
MWPTISNIDSNIEATIKGYANDNLAASKLNAWIRVYSGANSGLIMQSNTNFKLFSAAGEGNSIYGSVDMAGAVGTTWGGAPVTAGVGRALRPSPIITSFNSKEGQDQISRTCEFSITCFSLEQLELIQTYFMEPGYSVAIEWGWNTANGASGLITTGDETTVLNAIADTTLNNGALSAKRTSTNGEYDIFLGFILGSTVSNDGENFKVDVKLRGAPSLPTYLQSQNRIEVKSSGQVITDPNNKQPYSDSQITQEGIAGTSPESRKLVAERRFKAMFNELPAQRQTDDVKGLINSANMFDYINFDAVVSKKINEFIEQNEGYLGVFGDPVVEFNFEGGSVELEKEKLFSKNRYIKFSLAAAILNKMGKIDHYQIGNKKVSFTIDTSKSIIGAFPNMFSTKASKLLIPGFAPNFMFGYFLTPGIVEQVNTGALIIDGKKFGTAAAKNFRQKFVGQKALNENGLKEQAFYYGYLNTLYVNFDMFKEKLEQKNKTIREILQDILNEMSSAVNSFWNFQIVEGEESAGNIIITVVDENWIGQNPNPEATKIFKHSGVGSPFLNSSLDISIPAEMANKIINDRLGNTSQADMSNIKVSDDTLFNSSPDLFLKKIKQSAQVSGSQEQPEAEKTETEIKQEKLEDIRQKLVPNVDETKTQINEDGGKVFKNSSGYPLYTTDKNGKIIDIETSVRGNWGIDFETAKSGSALVTEIQTAAVEEITSRITSNLDKIDVLPIPALSQDPGIKAESIRDTVQKLFMVYCYDDTDFFDKMKNYYFEKKSSLAGSATGLSHPLPIKYSFTILGNSGIRRGDTFNIDGIPAKYKNRGIFQVTEVEHSISNMRWETTVTGQYRQEQ